MEMVEAIQKAGVVGAGGAGFPTHVKLNAKAEYFIVNAAECEPLIETDKYLCRTYAERIVATVEKIAAHLEAAHAVIALKAKYVRETEALQNAVKALGANVEIFTMRTYYPAGDEQVLVNQVTGRVVPERGLPLNVGCVVENVGTVLNIADALEGKPVDEKFLSITGAVETPVMCHAPIGTPITEVLKKAKLLVNDYVVILGGPMMGKMQKTREEIENAVVTKITGNLLVLPKNHYLVKRAAMSVERMARQAATACLQCRACTDLCPRHLLGHNVQPHMIMRTIWRQKSITDPAEFERAFGSAANCSSCGTCEMFSCPMGLSPRKMNDYAKGLLRERGIQPEKNQHPQASDMLEHRRIPTGRLIARLGLDEYVFHGLPELFEVEPEEVFIPLSQHIGKPAVPVVTAGDAVKKDDLIAGSAEGLSANIHTGFDGVVKEVTPKGIRISRREA